MNRLFAARLFAASLVITMTAAGQSSKPDLSGYWNLPYFPNMAPGADAEAAIPYTPLGLAAFKNRDLKDDPTALCHYPGVPRIMSSPYPMQIIQTPEYVVMAFEYMQLWRVVPTDHREHPKNVQPTFMGDSVGWWEGDTFVVDTIGLNDKTWLDTAGHQHSDALHVIERFRRTAPDTIVLNFTVDDPKMYSKPWNHERILKPLRQTPGLPMILEYECNENNRDVQHLISTKPAADR
jgi:hypothetical protein